MKKKNFKNLAQFRVAKIYGRDDPRPYIPKAVKERILNKYGGRCYLCGLKPDKLAIDHKEPWIMTHDNSETNLFPCCYACNNFKTIFTIEQLRFEISKQVERARKYSLNFRIAEKFFLIVETTNNVIFYFERVKDDKK